MASKLTPSKEPPCGVTILYSPENRPNPSTDKTVFEYVHILSPGAHPLTSTTSIVAIHGLNGHALNTFTHPTTRVLWLRDLLPDALPNSRIMTFGYNAKFKNFTVLQDLRCIAKKLLSELVDVRKGKEVCFLLGKETGLMRIGGETAAGVGVSFAWRDCGKVDDFVADGG
jgi:hypothetical protein